jgi:hypothetical protein
VGVADWLELGGYLQFLLGPGGDGRFGGTKLRAKMVLPDSVRERLHIPVFLGINTEIGKVPVAVEKDGWANEFRPIIGWKDDRWLLAFNPIFGYALSGPDKFRIEFEPCAKVGWNTQLGFSVGAEYYAGLGFIGDGFLPRHEQQHLLFAAVDLVEPGHHASAEGTQAAASPWELNLAAGGALTDATGQHVIVKAIIGRSF